MRESIIFYQSFYKAIKGLPKKSRLELFEAICEYAFYGNQVELSGIPAMLFTVMKPQLDANTKRYENGSKGGRPPKNKTDGFEEMETNGYESDKPNKNENENVNDNANENVNANANGSGKHFSKPTIEEIRDYISEKGYTVNADQSFDYYESVGWKVGGKSSMKDWKASVRTWQAKEPKPAKPENGPDWGKIFGE